MRLHISRIPALYLYLSDFPSQSSSFPSLAITTTANRSSLSTLTMSLSSSLPASASAGTTSTSKNNVGLSDIGNGNGNGNENSSITSWRDKIETSIAKSRKIRGGNYVQIATVDHTTLEPRCRTVVFRGFLKPDPNKAKAIARASQSQPCIMKMITDKRSNKFQEVTMSASNLTSTSTSNPQQKGTCSSRNSAEMVWWFLKSSEQYRIRGQLKFVGAGETEPYLLQSRKEQWGNLSDMAREQFYWEDPGLTYSTSTEKENAGDSGGEGGDGGDGHGEGTIPAGGRDEHGKVLAAPDNFLLMLLYPTRCDYLRLTDNFRQVDDIVEGGNEWTWASTRVNP